MVTARQLNTLTAMESAGINIDDGAKALDDAVEALLIRTDLMRKRIESRKFDIAGIHALAIDALCKEAAALKFLIADDLNDEGEKPCS